MSFTRLLIRNITQNAFRSGIILFSALLISTMTLFAFFVVRGAQAATQSSLEKLGADLIVIPWGTRESRDQDIRLMSLITNSHFPRTSLQKVSAVQGVEAVSPQLYLATDVNSSFSTQSLLYLVAYDPATDFTLKPWFEQFAPTQLEINQAVAGSNIVLPSGQTTLTIGGVDLQVAYRLKSTGSEIDDTVFISFESAQSISKRLKNDKTTVEVDPSFISAIMVRVASSTLPQEVSIRISKAVAGAKPIMSTNLFQSQRNQLIGLIRSMIGILAGVWVAASLFEGLIFSIAIQSRRREIGMLRALGAPQSFILKISLAEGLFLALAGGLPGILIAVLYSILARTNSALTFGLPMDLPSSGVLFLISLVSLFAAVISVLIAAWVPAQRISRSDPAVTMRE